jgi:uncharacterized protein (UPF0303 family)
VKFEGKRIPYYGNGKYLFRKKNQVTALFESHANYKFGCQEQKAGRNISLEYPTQQKSSSFSLAAF